VPFTFYVQQGKWDLPPGFENGYNSRFSRMIGLECMSCHDGYPDFVQGSVNKFSMIPLGIDCERCHGPGSIHVKTKMEGKIVNIQSDTDFTIVNPRKLPYDRQIDVCQRCHLQGDAVLKDGKSFYDFRPGMKLSSVMDEFLPVYENQEQGFLMAAHAERLHKSKCFLQSQDEKNPIRLNCITCHNPHISVKVTPEEYFIQKCMGCHTEPHKNDPQVLQTKGSNCITCHMPRSSAVDIPHVNITDHYIRVVKGKPENSVIGMGKFKGLVCVNNPKTDELTLARAYMYFYEKFQHDAYNMDSAWKHLQAFSLKRHEEDYIYYYYLKNNFARAAGIAREYKNTFKDAISNYQTGQSFENIGEKAAAEPYLQKAAQQQPYNLDYRIKLAELYLDLGKIPEARQQLQFVIKENPKLPAAWNVMGYLEGISKNYEESLKNLGKALALDPDYAPAHINMANLKLNTGDAAGAIKEVKLVLARKPDHPQALALKNYLLQKGAKW
jgi:hypothetical protein